MCLASAPRRARAGAVVGTFKASSGAEVTGPTHMAATGPRIASRMSPRSPVLSARINIESTAGALVKLTASIPADAMASIIRSSSVGSSGGSHR